MTDAYVDDTSLNTVNKARKLKLPPITPNPHASGLPSKLPPGLASSSDSLVSDWLYAHKVSRIIAHTLPNEKYTIPATTQQEIGWPWLRVQSHLGLIKENGTLIKTKKEGKMKGPVTLERYGRHARGRGDVMLWFGGCRESLP
jgi:hypothetical protein